MPELQAESSTDVSGAGRPLVVDFDVPTSVDEVRRFIIDDYFDNHTRWDRGLEELVALEPGPVRAGQRGREVRRFLGRQETEFEVVEVADDRLRLRDVPSMWTLERTYALAATPNGTRVSFTFDMAPARIPFRLVYPLARLIIARQVQSNMDVLASLLR